MNTENTTRIMNFGSREKVVDLAMKMEVELYKRSVKISKRDLLIKQLRKEIRESSCIVIKFADRLSKYK